MGVATGCGFKEIYRFPHTTYPYSSCICSFFIAASLLFVHFLKCFSFFNNIYWRFEEGLNTKVKLDIYKRFGKSVEFKKYLHGVCDAGSRLLFKFRSGIYAWSK